MSKGLKYFHEGRTLFRFVRCGAPIADELVFADASILERAPPMVGYVYTPASCRFFRINDDGVAVDSAGRRMRLADAFEMRLFSKMWDLRWRRDGDTANMTILTDVVLPGFESLLTGFKSEEAMSVSIRTSRQLLWGKFAGSPRDGWTRLSSQRIGSIDVPFVLPTGGSHRGIGLHVREYFTQDQETGNWVFRTSRLAGLVAARKEKSEEAAADV